MNIEVHGEETEFLIHTESPLTVLPKTVENLALIFNILTKVTMKCKDTNKNEKPLQGGEQKYKQNYKEFKKNDSALKISGCNNFMSLL